MALNFNPFEKDKPAETPKTGRKSARHKVFESPPIPEGATSETEPSIKDKALSRGVRPDNFPLINDSLAAETDSKPVSNGYQMDSKVVTEPVTKLEQSDNKVVTEPVTKLEQSDNNFGMLLNETYNKVVTEPVPQPVTKLEQTCNKVITNSSVEALSGIQQNVLRFIYYSCRESGGKVSSAISIKNLAISVRASVGVARTSANRLERKGFIRRFEYKDGRGGWTRYELPDEVYRQLLFRESWNKVGTNQQQSGNKVVTEPVTEPVTSLSSSSSYLNNKRTTTRSASDDFETWLAEINFSVFSPSITQSLVRRCFELHQNLNPLEFEKLLSRFSVHLNSKNNGVKNARGLLISFAGQLAKGQVPLEEIEEPEDVLARKWIDEMKQAKVARENLEKEACDLAFDEWFESLSQESKDQIAQPNSVMISGHPTQRIFLKSHFAENIWPQQKRKFTETRND